MSANGASSSRYRLVSAIGIRRHHSGHVERTARLELHPAREEISRSILLPRFLVTVRYDRPRGRGPAVPRPPFFERSVACGVRMVIDPGNHKEPWRVLEGDCGTILGDIPTGSVDLVYADPPFATNQVQKGRSGRPGVRRPVVRSRLVSGVHAGAPGGIASGSGSGRCHSAARRLADVAPPAGVARRDLRPGSLRQSPRLAVRPGRFKPESIRAKAR